MILPEHAFSVNNTTTSGMPMSFTPTVPLRLISEAALALARKPHQPLEIHEDYRTHIEGALGSTVLEDILEQNRRGVRDPFAPQFKAKLGRSTTGSCAQAEELFLNALWSSASRSVRIFLDTFGEPVLYEKSARMKYNGARSGLALQDVTIGDITWPAGTLVEIKTRHNMTGDQSVMVTSHDQVESVAPLRLSAFTFPPQEREPFLRACNGLGVGHKTIADIRDSVIGLVEQA
jgi:hypothetical protein